MAKNSFQSLKDSITPAEVVPAAPADATTALANTPEAVLASLSNMDDALDLGGALSSGESPHKWPVATIADKNWKTRSKDDLTEEQKESAPNGSPPSGYWAVYLGARVGATIWPSKGGDGKSSVPIGAYVFPSPRGDARVSALLKKSLNGVSRSYQFTKQEEKFRWDAPLGHHKADMQLFAWAPGIGFVVLNATGFKGVDMTWNSLAAIKPVPSTVYSFILDPEPPRKNAGAAQKGGCGIKLEYRPDHKRAVTVATEFSNYLKDNGAAVAAVVEEFKTGADFKGMSLDEVEVKLDEYYAAGLAK